MITEKDRKLATILLRLRLWKYERSGLWRTPTLIPCWGTCWLHDRMTKRQTRDGLHHAPACEANEWSGAHLVTVLCNCGAARQQQKANP